MKTKPTLIIITSMFLLVSILLFVKCRTAKPETAEINQFLTTFNNYIKAGNTDSLLACFDIDKKPAMLKRLVNLLEGKKNINGKEKPIFNLSLDIEADRINLINNDFVEAIIPVNFSHNSLDTKLSFLTLKIKKSGPHQFKIVQADARQLLTDYLAYEDFVRSKTIPETDVFSPETLAAFKTAEKLKTRYDSVVWFAHLNNKTFFYVVKGKWSMFNDINREKDSVIEPYKMGLVSPELKEIIPTEFDLIHNINSTFPNLVEVEKDGKKGFYTLDGKIAVPVNYDQIFPINDEVNLAVLRIGNDYFYLKKDMSISEKVDLKISDFFSKIKNINNSFDLYTQAMSVITEYNSKVDNGAIYVPPSYLVDLNMIDKVKDFKNPLRKSNDDEDGVGDIHKKYLVSYSGKDEQSENWLEASFYSIRDYFLGGRSEFYDKKNLIIVDKKLDRVLTANIDIAYTEDGGEALGGPCDVNSIKVINDSLFEVKAGATLWVDLYDTAHTITGGPYYHYLAVKNNKLIELRNHRNFGFTKYVKMDDSYLNGCYNMMIGNKIYDKNIQTTLDHITPEMLRYIKNEIYADYRYQFNDKRWQDIFLESPAYYDSDRKSNNANVDDSLTVIDKYNINWINQKLNAGKTKPNALAAK